MRGLRLDVVPVNLAPVPPLPSRRSFIVHVHGHGMEGWGEICCEPFSPSRYDVVLQEWIRQFPSWVLTLTGDGVQGLPGAPSPVVWGVESALLDALARREDRPLATLLASRVSPVQVWAWGGEVREGAWRAYQTAREQGYSVIKYKLRRLKEDLRHLARMLRGRTGPELWLDANGHFALQAWRHMEVFTQTLPLRGVEEPCASWEQGCAALPFPVWLDESVVDPEALMERLHSPIAGVVLKPARLGSWQELKHRVERIRSAGKAVVLTHVLEGNIGRLHALHRAAALGLPGPHGLHLPDGEPVWAVGDAPGIGEVNP